MNANAAKLTPSWRDVLPIHPACELFPPMAPDELRALGEDIAKNGLTSPIALWCADKRAPAVLLDGRNRLDAIEANTGCQVQVVLEPIHQRSSTTLWSIKAGEWISDDKLVVLDGSVDPFDYVVSANIRRRHLSIEDKDRLIVQLLKADPAKSNRTVAKLTDTSHPHVAKVRAELEKSGDVETVTTAVDTKGRKQPARKSKPQSKAKPRAERTPQVSEEILQQRAAAAAERIRSLMDGNARNDIGADSPGEMIRKDAEIEELRNSKRKLEIENVGLRSEIEALNDQLIRNGEEATERYLAASKDIAANTYGVLLDAWQRASADDRHRFLEYIAAGTRANDDGALPAAADESDIPAFLRRTTWEP
jgi:hypothetical protein